MVFPKRCFSCSLSHRLRILMRTRNPQNRSSRLSKVCFETSALFNQILNNPVFVCLIQIAHFDFLPEQKGSVQMTRKTVHIDIGPQADDAYDFNTDFK